MVDAHLQHVSGAGAVAAQVVGDHNQVHIIVGGATLALEKLHERRAEPQSIIELLRVDIRATRLVGRDAPLNALAAWRDDAASISVRCIAGQAGAGKTRLAIEACEAAEAAGWAAGFVSSEELRRFHEANNLVHWRLDRDTLVVLDYAASSLLILKSWLGLLAPHRDAPADHKLRILLLERHADPDMGWWADLARRESLSRAGPADLIGGEQPVRLTPLDGLEDRRALLAQAMELAAPLLDPPRAARVPPALGADPWFDRRLGDTRIENGPLYLVMAGVHAARHGATTALSLDRGELAFAMADIEQARLRRFAAARGFRDDGALLCHLAACVTLQNGCQTDALLALVREEMEAMAFPAPMGPEGVAGALLDALSTSGAGLDAIRPDLIGEAFLLRTIDGGPLRPPEASQAIVLRAYHRDVAGVVGALVRCAVDHAEGRRDHAAPDWLGAVVDQSSDVTALMRISDDLPEQTLALRELAAAIEARIASILRSRADGHVDFQSTLAGSLNNLANRLSALGQREAALEAAQEAVELYRTLAAARPDAFTPDLAGSLNNLAAHLSDLGQGEAALEAAQEAVKLYRALAAARPDAFTRNLAMSLNNLANCLSDLGQGEAALEAAQEAVELHRTLATARPDAFTPNLANSLNNLANCLSDLGQGEAALEAAQEAVELYRTLAAARPDAFTPDLAGSLNNLAAHLSDLGQGEAALEAAREAVELHRALAAARPDAFTPDLAMSISVLADALEAHGRPTEAVAHDHEAVATLSPYLQAQPEVYAVRMLSIVQDYVRRAAMVQIALDEELLEPILERLAPFLQKNLGSPPS
ncbi:MAG: tetratricopeptide repeat protein [Phenylobacterium sp.]|uniref:tetratricopeptide repeat protein n=1 Tax=Phenylobacterium sp. TaxID=1871053 RepID=UPI0025DF0644|nr:tetratricopeptide repeat protein [Phenylobacterium sp.]MBI1200300.1 tetratricopeptide repeat protein [Phenylobacterium sp.]